MTKGALYKAVTITGWCTFIGTMIGMAMWAGGGKPPEFILMLGASGAAFGAIVGMFFWADS